jgi:heptosyltransferase I
MSKRLLSLSDQTELQRIAANAQSICIVLLTGLGDVIHGLPVATALKRAAPERRITWVAEPMPAGILQHHPAVDDVVVFRKSDGLSGVRALRRDLSRRSFDLTLNLNVYFKSVFPTVLSRAPHRLGFGRGRAREGVWLFANHHLPRVPRRHTQDMFLEFLDALHVSSDPIDWKLQLTEAEQADAARFFAQLSGRPVAALVPASANAQKDWLPERYAEVADALTGDYGMDVVLLGGPGGREIAAAREIQARARVPLTWAMGDGVRRLLGIIAGSRLVIAPDTGPVHMARALDVPVVGLYGHTNPWRVGPYRKFEDLWVDAYTHPHELPDASRAEPRYGRMERINASDVLARVDRVLAT